MNKLGKLIASIILIVLGLFFIIYGFIVYKSDFIDYGNRVYVTGEIIEIKGIESTFDSTHRLAVIRYEVDGEEMTSEISYRSIAFADGSIVEIYYDKNYPEMISSKTSDTLMIVSPIVGFICFIIGILWMLKKNKKKKMKRA